MDVTPLPTNSLHELFRQATARELVFEDKGLNFQDAVIFHSIVDRLATAPHEHGLLISDDGIFKRRKEECEAYATTRGVSQKVLRLDDAEKHFTQLLGDDQKIESARLQVCKLYTIKEILWCPGRDLNPHSRCREKDFKSFASAGFATRAR